MLGERCNQEGKTHERKGGGCLSVLGGRSSLKTASWDFAPVTPEGGRVLRRNRDGVGGEGMREVGEGVGGGIHGINDIGRMSEMGRDVQLLHAAW